MKLSIMAVILFAGAPLFAQPQIIIDNRTHEQIDTARLERLAYEASVHSTASGLNIVLHVWPKKDVRSKNSQKLESFFTLPNEIYLSKMDYLSFVQGVMLAAFPNSVIHELEQKSRRIFVAEQAIVEVRKSASDGR